MKFMLFMLPTIPATYEERARLRPIGRNVERTQLMIEQVREIAERADAWGLDALALTEHHFHSEGLELSPAPMTFLVDLAARTQRIKLATLIMALPTWDPIRLAEEIAMLDHLTRGRFIAGIGRGYQDRWVKVLGQKYDVAGATSDDTAADRHNREVFEELYTIMKLAWTEDAISYDGKHYQIPAPFAEGIKDWAVADNWTALYGAPDELDAANTIRKISVVPKPYTQPHPEIWQAHSGGADTIDWCAREDITLWSLASTASIGDIAREYCRAAAQHGRQRSLGERFGAFRMVYIGDSYEEAYERGAKALGDAFVRYFSGFGFFESFRRSGETGAVPISFERMVEARFAIVGTVDQVRDQIAELRDDFNPEWFGWYFDQGLMPQAELLAQLQTFTEKVTPGFRGTE
ncbi:MAG: alkanesulfonate monooxygenase SsuD [Gammaproteobacteria bacterium]|jgi:alkanesulfonate monooxygenase SsuD/methylene tetrahydromethanopterin reductase-like flavin-dependent oxidoreductase (luciferase family)